MEYYLGIDLGGTNLKYGVLDKNRKLKDYNHRPIQDSIRPQEAIFFIKNLIKRLSRKYDLSAVGFGLPGLVDYKRGYIYYLVNLKNWKDIRWKQILEKELNLPVFLDNDVNVATLAEYYLGAGQGCLNMVMITLGTGVGGGLILSRKLYRGKDNLAGEIGHIPLSFQGPLCNCGGRACLESYIGNRRLIQQVKNLLRRHPESLLARMGEDIQLEDVTSAARKGDKFALDFWKGVSDKLGLVLTGIVNLLNPEKIIIGGGVSNAGSYLFNPLRDFVRKRAMNIQGRSVKILRSKLRDKAGVIGSALLAMFSLEGIEY